MSIPEVSSKNRLLQFLQKHFSSVSFSARLTSNQTISHATYTIVQFDEKTFGVGYDTSAYHFVAPYAGKYFFDGSVKWQNMASTTANVSLTFLQNDGQSDQQRYLVAFGEGVAESNADYTLQGSILLDLAAQDTVAVECRYYDTSSGTEEIYGSSNAMYRQTQFCGYKV